MAELKLEEIIGHEGVEVFGVKGFCDIEGFKLKPAGMIQIERGRVIGVEDGTYAIYIPSVNVYLGVEVNDGELKLDSTAKKVYQRLSKYKN